MSTRLYTYVWITLSLSTSEYKLFRKTETKETVIYIYFFEVTNIKNILISLKITWTIRNDKLELPRSN